jgi:hypothetical protein
MAHMLAVVEVVEVAVEVLAHKNSNTDMERLLCS